MAPLYTAKPWLGIPALFCDIPKHVSKYTFLIYITKCLIPDMCACTLLVEEVIKIIKKSSQI